MKIFRLGMQKNPKKQTPNLSKIAFVLEFKVNCVYQAISFGAVHFIVGNNGFLSQRNNWRPVYF